MKKRMQIVAGSAAAAILAAGIGLAVGLPAQANIGGSPVQTGPVEDGTNDGETADDQGVEDGTDDGETADDQGVEDGTDDGETADD